MDPTRREQWINAGERAIQRDIEREIYKQADKEDTYQTQALIPDGCVVSMFASICMSNKGECLASIKAQVCSRDGKFDLVSLTTGNVVYRGIDPLLVEQLVILFGLDEL